MKSATVADLRNNFSRISKWIEEGETVHITKRGRQFAKLEPESTKPKDKVSPVNHMDRLKKIYGDDPVKGDSQAIISEARGEQ